ncbi:putative nitroreductase [Actinoplanes missouriensis 431]|uniref:Putative nitroreductase n=1 Tax=Actinoplanes missouriensis (strain ATCC 14538 / DSM 43046 / CBS 188.64 / JCM 3121 / NBRC 102363 / NCIMB 12654 / NRRL B-3342 / UNCC 431) TaxID=512565 RepID=I0GXX6_ACTM4|nr:nitroreductase family protein [Actinoplanes missouriensis]BAL85613.1 putative nitroreductase [Actinoplanes missouriensis 431]
MEFDEVVRRRRMVRGYDPDRPVPPALVDKIIKHGLRAPSAGFSQGWSFLVLTAAADRSLFWGTLSSGSNSWLDRMSTAPLVIVALSNKSVYIDRYAEADKGWTDRDESRWPVPYWDIDTGFASLLMHLTAVNEGLGSCFIGLPADRVGAFKQAFGVPEAFTPIGALTVGYRGDDKRSPSLRRGHRPVDDVVHHGRWASTGEV